MLTENYVELEIFSTYVPHFDYNDSIQIVYNFFKEKPFYKYIVIVKEGKPIGILNRENLVFVDKNTNIGELAKPLPKVKNTNINPERLSDVIEILRLQVSDVLLVDAKNQYIGVLNYETILHYLTKFPETSRNKISNMIGKDNACFIIGFKNIKVLKEEFGYKIDSLFKIINELLKNFSKDGCIYIEKIEEDIWSVHKAKLSTEVIFEFLKEFYKEYNLLFKEHEDIILYGIVIELSNIKNFKSLKDRVDILKVYIKDIKNTVVIFDGLPPLLKTYVAKKNDEIVAKIRKNIIASIKNIADKILKTEKNLWEFVAYDMLKIYTFYDLLYIMNENGIQISNNIISLKSNKNIIPGKKGADRSKEIYFERASYEPYITEVYLSKATDDFCITTSIAFDYENKKYVLAGDISYSELAKIGDMEI